MLLRWRVIPKRVTLLNRHTFYASYGKTSRRNLPRNVTITKNRRIGPRKHRTRNNQQSGSILGNIVKLGTKFRPNLFRQGVKLGATNLLKQGVSAGTKAFSSDTEKGLIDEWIKHAPDLYRFGTSKIKM